MERKPDDQAIAAFVDSLGHRYSLSVQQHNWSRYLFHLTDVHNAANILRTGRLFCRTAATAQDLMATENAAPSIVQHSDRDALDHVRLYFRPRTATFYANEGMRPLKQRQGEAHCPMPIALLFDAKFVLGLAASRFTDGGHNRHSNPPNIGNDLAFLQTLPWEVIFKGNLLDKRLSDVERKSIVHRQHAEIQIPHQLTLEGLSHVYVRSPAEADTLRTLLGNIQNLPPAARAIEIPPGGIFFDRWTYVERVEVLDHEMRIRFNGDSATPGPFTFKIRYSDPAQRLPARVRTTPDFYTARAHTHRIPDEYAGRRFRLTLHLDDSLAYLNDITPTASGSQLIS